MKRKLIIALLIVVLVLSLVTAAACKHKHNYTEWGSDNTNHWKYCEKCKEIDESSKEPHDFTNGNCVCGKEAPASHEHDYSQWYKDDPVNHWKVCPVDNAKDNTTVAPHDYGTTGKCVCGREEPLTEYNVEVVVVLRKLGTETNSNDGVTLTLSDKNGELPTEITKDADGKFTFKAYPGIYEITAAKDGFIDAKGSINITKEEGDLTGENAFELEMEYDAFYHGINDGTADPDWTGDYGHPEHIDKTHVNDADPYFIIKEGTNDFYQYSNELYDDVAFGVTYNSKMANEPTIALVFGKKSVTARVQPKDDGYKIQWRAEKVWMEENLINKWDIDGYTPISADLKAKYEGDGIELKLIRRGGMVTLMVDGVAADTQLLPAEYADQQCRVTFIIAGVSGGTELHYNISTEVEKTAVTVTNPTVENGAIEVAGTNIGDHFVLSVKPDESCKLTSLKVNEQERIADISEGRLDLGLYTAENLTIAATFTQYTLVNVDVAISGNRLGTTVDLNDKTVTLTDAMGAIYDVVIADGKLTKQLPDGNYTVTLDGYVPYELTVPKDGSVEEIVLAYNLLENMDFNQNWGNTIDLSQMNNGKFTTTNGNTVAVKSVDTFGNVKVTLKAHKTNVANGENDKHGKQGVWFLFKTASGYDAVSITIKDSGAIEFDRSDWWKGNSGIKNETISAKLVPGKDGWWLADDDNKGIYQTLSASEMSMYEEGTFELSVIRYGNYFYVYVNGEYTGNWCVVNEAYSDVECYIGFVGTETFSGKDWNYSIEENVTLPELTVKLPENLENGSVELTAKSYKLGDQVTLNIKLEENYVVDSLKVNGTEIKNRIKNDQVSFTPTSEGEVVIEIKIIRVVYVNLDVDVSGNRLGTSVDLSDSIVTLTDIFGKSTQLTVANGKLTQTDFPAGTYTVTLEGYMPATLVVPEEGTAQAVVLEYKLFENMEFSQNWGNRIDFSQMNNGKFTTTNGNTVAVKSTDTYGNVQVTLKAHYGNGGKQGIWFLFPTDAGYDAVSIIIKDSGAIEFDKNDWWSGASHIKNETKGARNKEDGWWLADDDNNSIYQLLSPAEAMMYEAGTFELSVLRYGNYFYIYINGVYSANWCVVNEAYTKAKCYIGFVGTDTISGKDWNYTIEENVTLPELNVKLPETVENGSVELAAESYKLGDQVTLNLTVNENCFIAALRVNGVDIKHRISDNTVVFTPTTADNIVVEYVVEKITENVSIDSAISGQNFDGTVSLNGRTATLTNKADSTKTYSIVIANDKLIGTVTTGLYTLSVPEYMSVEVAVVSTGIEGDIVLKYDAFDFQWNWDKPEHDFSQIYDSNGSKIVCDYKTLNVITKDTYQNVSVSMTVRDANSRNGNDMQGIILKFGDKFMMLRSATYDNQFRLTYITELAGSTSWLTEEINMYFFNEGETRAIKCEGIELKVIRSGDKLFAFIGGKLVNVYTLPDEYKDLDVNVGFFGFDSAPNTVWDFEISKDFTLPEYTITNSTPSGSNGTVDGVPATVVAAGETVTLTITPATGYALKTLTVNGQDVTSSVVIDASSVGTYQLVVMGDVTVSAVFESIPEETPAA